MIDLHCVAARVSCAWAMPVYNVNNEKERSQERSFFNVKVRAEEMCRHDGARAARTGAKRFPCPIVKKPCFLAYITL